MRQGLKRLPRSSRWWTNEGVCGVGGFPVGQSDTRRSTCTPSRSLGTPRKIWSFAWISGIQKKGWVERKGYQDSVSFSVKRPAVFTAR